MTNEIMAAENNHIVVHREGYPTNVDSDQSYPVRDVRISKLVDEVIAASRDDRMNTMRAITAAIAVFFFIPDSFY